MSVKEYYNQTEFAAFVGTSRNAISKAINPKNGKPARLKYWQGRKEIYINDPLTQAFINNVPKERLFKPGNLPATGETIQPGNKSESMEEAEKGVLLAQDKKLVEEAEFKKQQRIEKQLKNAVLMGQQVKIESINTLIMVYFDQWLNTCKRRFNGSVDEFLRMAFKIFENEQGSKDPDFKPHDISRAEIKRKWATSFEKWQHEGNKESMKRLLEIQKEQGEN